MSIPNAEVDKIKAQAAKQKGNDAFGKKQWPEAVGFYTEAHRADPAESTYPLNRAMAYIKLSKYLDAERDCTTALSLSPDNVKALYRRATARVGADKLVEAQEDYAAVLRLDPANVEARAGLAKTEDAIKAGNYRAKKREPIDLTPFTHGANGKGPSSKDVDRAQARETNSSVEAARRFLQQVGMSGESDNKEATSRSKTTTSTVPPKFPGETGGFLREVTTRKTLSQAEDMSNIPDKSTPLPQTSVSPASRPSQQIAMGVQSYSTTHPEVVAAKKTASALNFGASSSSRSNTTSIPAQTRQISSSKPGRLSAIEFNRQWKNKSERLQLLSSIDPESIPSMFDAMLEPELVADILQTLVESCRSSQASDLTSLIEGILTALPRCKRFGMTVSMLDSTEKGHAAYLIDATDRLDLKSNWEIS